jgi:predicted dienelactone hydrolase
LRSSTPSIRAWSATALAAWCFAAGTAHAAFALPPLALPGPHPVACSNVAQDFSRVAPGEDVEDYWNGTPRGNGAPRYATELLADPANTLAVTVDAPNNDALYGSFAGRAQPYVVIVCYPTTPANARPDYPLPTGKIVPRMQRGAEPPVLADAATRYPLLLFTHGYGGSPLSSDYIDALSVFASFGYIVAAPFHGDPRYSDLRIDNLNDVVYALTHLRDFIAMQALRPLSLSATLDLLLAHPQWRDRIDATRIGGFGASQGGESLLLMAGAGLTTSIGLSWTQVTKDARLKAGVGYIPYFGQPILPAFGRDQRGLEGTTLPYLAISGTADTTAPIQQTAQGLAKHAGPHELVALVGVTHHFDERSAGDIFTWALTFLDAEVRGDPLARAKLLQMTSVAGGGDDRVQTPYSGPLPGNYAGSWWAAPAGSESGWGTTVAHQGDDVVLGWYTYDATGRPWWLSMAAIRQAGANGDAYTGTLYASRGPPFNAVPFDPAQVTRTAVGTGTLTFGSADSGTFAYSVQGAPAQVKPITRVVFGPVPACVFRAQPELAAATNYQDLWWATGGAESGWGLVLTHQGDAIFAGWFTYDADGAPLWLTGLATKTAPGVYSGTLIRTTGPAFDARPFDPARVTRTPVGTLTLTFANGNAATFAYTVNGAAQTKTITRALVHPPAGTVCQ